MPTNYAAPSQSQEAQHLQQLLKASLSSAVSLRRCVNRHARDALSEEEATDCRALVERYLRHDEMAQAAIHGDERLKQELAEAQEFEAESEAMASVEQHFDVLAGSSDELQVMSDVHAHASSNAVKIDNERANAALLRQVARLLRSHAEYAAEIAASSQGEVEDLREQLEVARETNELATARANELAVMVQQTTVPAITAQGASTPRRGAGANGSPLRLEAASHNGNGTMQAPTQQLNGTEFYTHGGATAFGEGMSDALELDDPESPEYNHRRPHRTLQPGARERGLSGSARPEDEGDADSDAGSDEPMSTPPSAVSEEQDSPLASTLHRTVAAMLASPAAVGSHAVTQLTQQQGAHGSLDKASMKVGSDFDESFSNNPHAAAVPR